MLRSTIISLGLLLGVAAAMPEALAQATETTTAEPRARARGTNSTTTPRQPSPAQLAARQRMRDCGAEWRGMRGTPQAQNRTWRQFSSECLARRRGADAPASTSRRRARSAETTAN